ncbi:MAG: methyltransferase domain-containing protein [Gemmatimonadales bacterium]
MKWKNKARLQNAVAALPFASGKAYFAMQRVAGGLRKGLNNPVDRFIAAISMVDWIEAAGGSIEGKRFVEVGTGHMVNVPTALWLLGAGETLTVDLNRYLSANIVKESNQSIADHQAEVLQIFGGRADNDGFRKRFQQLVSFSGSLDALLGLMNVRYLSPRDAAALPLPDKSADFHISHTVLEHIPPPVMSKILAEAKRVMTPGGLLVHNIDPSDHFCHEDDDIPAVNFLQFSEKEWDRWAGNQFMYHNRLRGVEYLKLFERAGVHILKSETAVDDRSLSALQRGFPVDSRFAGMTNEELAVRWVQLIGKFDEV